VPNLNGATRRPGSKFTAKVTLSLFLGSQTCLGADLIVKVANRASSALPPHPLLAGLVVPTTNVAASEKAEHRAKAADLLLP